MQAELDSASASVVFALVDAGEPVGYTALHADDDQGQVVIDDIWIASGRRRQGFASAARLAAREWARQRGAAVISCTVDPTDPAQNALFGSYEVAAQRMLKDLADPPSLPAGVTARTMTDDEFERWHAETIAGYAGSLAASGVTTSDRATRESRRQLAELLPDGRDTADQSLCSLVAGAEQVATLWVCHHRRFDYSFVYNVTTLPERRGRGYGRAAMLLAESASLRAGDRQLGLNVFGHNRTAINLYDSLGYRITDQTRSLAV